MRTRLTTGQVIAVALAALGWSRNAFAGTVGVPEIDPGMATGGLALLVAGVFFLAERYRQR